MELHVFPIPITFLSTQLDPRFSGKGQHTVAWRPNAACFCKNIFTGEEPQPFIYVLSMVASTLPCQNRVVATEATQTTKPKLLSGPLQPCSSNARWESEETAGYLKETGDASMRTRICETEEANTNSLGTARRRKPKTNTQIQRTESKRAVGQHVSITAPQGLAGQPVGQRAHRLKGDHSCLCPSQASQWSQRSCTRSDPGLRVLPWFGGLDQALGGHQSVVAPSSATWDVPGPAVPLSAPVPHGSHFSPSGRSRILYPQALYRELRRRFRKLQQSSCHLREAPVPHSDLASRVFLSWGNTRLVHAKCWHTDQGWPSLRWDASLRKGRSSPEPRGWAPALALACLYSDQGAASSEQPPRMVLGAAGVFHNVWPRCPLAERPLPRQRPSPQTPHYLCQAALPTWRLHPQGLQDNYPARLSGPSSPGPHLTPVTQRLDAKLCQI